MQLENRGWVSRLYILYYADWDGIGGGRLRGLSVVLEY